MQSFSFDKDGDDRQLGKVRGNAVEVGRGLRNVRESVSNRINFGSRKSLSSKEDCDDGQPGNGG